MKRDMSKGTCHQSTNKNGTPSKSLGRASEDFCYLSIGLNPVSRIILSFQPLVQQAFLRAWPLPLQEPQALLLASAQASRRHLLA